MDPLTAVNTRTTPQNRAADPRQKRNAAGGYAFALGDEARIHRFLTLGTTGGTYYATEQKITADNAAVVLAAARNRGEWLTERAVEVSVAGRAPRQNPGIFALAAAAGLADDAGRKAALDNVPAVCRTGTTLFTFAGYAEQFRGWGRGLQRGVGAWYLDKDADALAYQLVKYRQREGWTHRDVLRLAHLGRPGDRRTVSPAHAALFDWATHGAVGPHTPALINAFEVAQRTTVTNGWVGLIEAFPLSWEMLPDAALAEPAVWQALIEKGMPQTALMRQLPRLTRLGVLTGATREIVASQLADPARLAKGRVHPMNVLVAMKTYAQGHSERGSSTWTPDRRIIDALDGAFYAAYGTVTPSGTRQLIALDVSGSMGYWNCNGLPITPREASAALALITMATEDNTDVVGFTSGSGLRSSGISELSISPRQRLDDVVRSISDLPFGRTDVALPMVWAEKTGRLYDSITVVTDNETWAGSIHPHQALRSYRDKTGLATRLAVVGMTANDVSVADPTDPGQLDIAGFDSAAPQLLADFFRGDI